MTEFDTLLISAGLDRDQFIVMAGISRRTFYRWRNAPPAFIYKMLKLMAGDLGQLHKDWQGWTLNRKGELVTPHNYCYGPGEVNGIYWRYQHTRLLKAQIRDQAPTPASDNKANATRRNINRA